MITCSTDVFGRTRCERIAAKFSTMTIARAPAILQLVLELARRVQRIDVDDRHAGSQDAEQRHRVLQEVRRHDGYAIAFREPRQLLQECGEIARQPIERVVASASGQGCEMPACRRTARPSIRACPGSNRSDRDRSPPAFPPGSSAARSDPSVRSWLKRVHRSYARATRCSRILPCLTVPRISL